MTEFQRLAMESLAELLEDGKKIAYKTAVVNGMFTVSVRVDPGNPMIDKTFTIDEKWLPNKIGEEWVFTPSFFQTFSKSQAKTAEERTMRTLVANLSKNGVKVMWIQDQPDGKVLVKLTNGSNFRVDPKWRPVFSGSAREWMFPVSLFEEYDTKPDSVKSKSLFADKGEVGRILDRGRTPAAGVDLQNGGTLPSNDVIEASRKLPTRISRTGNPVFANKRIKDTVEDMFGSEPGFNWLKYPGMPDAIAEINGKQVLIDFKTGGDLTGEEQPASEKKRVTLEINKSFTLKPDPNCPPEAKFENGFRKFLEKPPMTTAQLAKLLGKSEKWISQYVTKPPAEKHGYHTSDIPKGKAGEFSKIEEEFLEAKDAFENDNPVMLFLELADMLGAVERFLEVQHPTLKLDDVVKQAKLTNEVFRRGLRENRDPK